MRRYGSSWRWGHGWALGEGLATVRLGEQESCKITGVTQYEAKAGAATIRFDVSRLPVAPDDPDPLKAWMKPYLQVTYAGENPDRPPQVTGLKAFCRSGQVFVTWRQKEEAVAFYDQTYRVYRHDRPITAANLGEAALLGEVNRNSQLNVRRSQMCLGGGYTNATNFYAGSLMLDGKLPIEDRLATTGEWNGMLLAVHHAERFGSAACTMEGPWTAERLQALQLLARFYLAHCTVRADETGTAPV